MGPAGLPAALCKYVFDYRWEMNIESPRIGPDALLAVRAWPAIPPDRPLYEKSPRGRDYLRRPRLAISALYRAGSVRLM
jgi:hypothetical protein